MILILFFAALIGAALPNNQRSAPAGIITQSGLSGAVSTIQDDPDSPDGNWMTTIASTAGELQVSTDNMTVGQLSADNQEIRVLARKDANGGNDVDYTIAIREAGGGTDLATSSTQTLTTTTATVASFTWDRSILADISGADVEVYILQTSGHTGNPGNRRYLEIGAVEWNAVRARSRRIF